MTTGNLQPVLLNIGAGSIGRTCFRNIDIAPFAGTNGVEFMDLRERFEYEDNTVDIVLASHVLGTLHDIREHILREVHRVLKPGGWFRMDDNPGRFFLPRGPVDMKFGASRCWSREHLLLLLGEIGFRFSWDIDPSSTMIRAEPQVMRDILGNRTWHESFTVEAQK